ncbi:aldo/keto reductase [Rubellicoccus peritrichatus]|uniref:Aldo/keto reductase n=1 Tax=Rubellicoccus peritrichatus TaxID=3080537 RepID=A0AAQ3LDW7_9BACT|nr:aldo/keto reductase [Puniceicoccus sp. CR14]WOO42130.1 aldo/keto reductase [Puniceicoccus sp. CR14]
MSDTFLRKIANSKDAYPVLALGCWAFGGDHWGGQDDADSIDAMQKAWDLGLRHWDTAVGYGNGRSERLCGEFLRHGKRDEIFLATKANVNRKPEKLINTLYHSLENLQTDHIDLYYLHWPRCGLDMRPCMEALEKEREKGTIGQIGVSNFSIEQMQQLSQVGTIDVHQLGYSLYWRVPEKELIPYCVKHDIAVVTYSSIAQGILTGKFPQTPTFPKGDIRPETVFFQKDVWPHLYAATEKLKVLAVKHQRPLQHLAIQWAARQPGISSVIVGARNGQQVQENVVALKDPIPNEDLDAMTAISNEAMVHYPKEQNIFKYYP